MKPMSCSAAIVTRIELYFVRLRHAAAGGPTQDRTLQCPPKSLPHMNQQLGIALGENFILGEQAAYIQLSSVRKHLKKVSQMDRPELLIPEVCFRDFLQSRFLYPSVLI